VDSKKVGFRASAAAAAALFGRTPRSVIETDWCLECFGLAETPKGKQWGGGGKSRLFTLRKRISTETLPNVIKEYVAF